MHSVLKMQNITKSFPGIKANDNISFELRKSEVHAILGENGAGKSTLMNILFGIYKPDFGDILLNGEVVKIKGPNHANQLGIGMVHQHFKLVKNFTVTENIILGIEEVKNGVVDLSASRKRIVDLSEKYNLNVDPDAVISDITVGMQQRVEILKMLYRDADILIFDEPTAVLTPQQINDLMLIIEKFTKEGKSVILITHKLDEIMSVADRCTVLKTGKSIGTVDINKTNKDELSKMMVGREVNFKVKKGLPNIGDIVLKVDNLNLKSATSSKNILKNVNFEVRAGEVVTIAGIDGNGQSELIYSITGLIQGATGNIFVSGTDISNMKVRNRTLTGISHIPEDRHKHGLVLDYSLEQNLVLQEYFNTKYQKKGVLDFDEITKNAEELIELFDIRSGRGPRSIVRSMSGGNQQKAILAREIARSPDLLIAVQPTRGLDAGAIEYIHEKIIQERDKGKSILISSLELDEVMNISDRILVMFEGEIVADLNPDKTTYEEIGLFMSGSKRGVSND
ncbi:ABC transporter ATP-binding protein [Mycoplasmatota bacterium zrk1]